MKRFSLIVAGLLMLAALTVTATAQDGTPTPTPAPAGGDSAEPATLTGTTFAPAQRPYSDDLLAQLSLPSGFEIRVFAADMGNVRMIAVAEDGSIYITRREEGDVILLVDENADGASDIQQPRIVASDLPLLHGIAIQGNTVYLATDTHVYTADINEDGSLTTPQPLITDLPNGGQHPNRTLAFSPEGLLYITVGSMCNACRPSSDEEATILRAQPDGSGREVFAEGLRNTIGFGWHPETGELWGMDHGSDWRGDNEPPEELNRLDPSAHYGWPYCYGEQQPDVYVPYDPPGTTKDAFCASTAAPALTYQAHSAPIGMIFYTGEQFPEDYRNDAFVVMRGSWNRYPAVGYEVVRLEFDENGQPTGFTPFLTGFLIEDGTAHFARPAGIAIAPDGGLLLTDDTNGMVYHITYTGE